MLPPICRKIIFISWVWLILSKMINRRDFLKNTCTLCLAAGGMGAVTAFLSGCASLPVYNTAITENTLRIPALSLSPEENLKIIRSEKLDYDILLVKRQDKGYEALKMKCTHLDNGLVATKNGLICNLHGSRYNLQGEVTVGPALTALQKFKTETSNEQIIIFLK